MASGSITVFIKARHLRACPRKIFGSCITILPKKGGLGHQNYVNPYIPLCRIFDQRRSRRCVLS